jgi:molybdopterin molybdotransferase
LLDALLGLAGQPEPVMARLGATIKANDSRQDYIRATLRHAPDGVRIATAFARQDSSMQRTLRESHCLIVRPPLAPAAAEGDLVPILSLDF